MKKKVICKNPQSSCPIRLILRLKGNKILVNFYEFRFFASIALDLVQLDLDIQSNCSSCNIQNTMISHDHNTKYTMFSRQTNKVDPFSNNDENIGFTFFFVMFVILYVHVHTRYLVLRPYNNNISKRYCLLTKLFGLVTMQ
jgi:hypothetical protein